MNIEFESSSENFAIKKDDYDLDLALAMSESIKEKILSPKEVHKIVLEKMKDFLKN